MRTSTFVALTIAGSALALIQPAMASAPHPRGLPKGSTAAPFAAGPLLAAAPDAASITRRCSDYATQITRMRLALEQETVPATVARTLKAYDALIDIIASASGEFALYREVMADKARREAGGACEVAMSAEATKLSLSRPIYDRLKAIDTGTADAPTRYYLSRTLADFERSGVSLDAAGRSRAQALAHDIDEAGNAFTRNIAADDHSIKVDPAELAGLPADYIAAHKPGADGKITLGTATPDYVPVMTYATSRDLRRRFSLVYGQRAFPQNEANLRGLLDGRQDLAALVGRPNWAALTFENRMVNTPAKVQTLLDQMADAARPAAERDYARKLAVLRQSVPDATRLEPWDSGYTSQIVQRQAYGYDRQEARQYFAYNNVRDGILRLTHDLFGVEIRSWNTPKWDPLIETYEMFDHGKLIGQFYIDAHPRPGKYEHANMIPLRAGLAGRRVPMGALVMNLPAGDHSTGLMEHGDVVTFLHEYGHMLHHIFGGQTPRWAGQSGVATEWDFVEAPSQMLENWVYDYDTLKTFAVDKTGQTIPRALVDKMNNARYFDLGTADMRQIALSNISLQFHLARAPADLGAAYRAYDAKYDPMVLPVENQGQDGFPHLNGYSAAYYTYRQSVLIADDMFTRFQSQGLRDAATARRYRELVLAPGGTRPAAELVADFLGRPLNIDAYRAKLAKDK